MKRTFKVTFKAADNEHMKTSYKHDEKWFDGEKWWFFFGGNKRSTEKSIINQLNSCLSFTGDKVIEIISVEEL